MKLALAFAALALASSASAQAQGEQAPNRYWATPDHEGRVTHGPNPNQQTAQSDVQIVAEAGAAALISKKAGVRSVIAWKGYLLNEGDLSEASLTNGFDADGYSITPEGIWIEGSVHGPDALIPWKAAGSELDHILSAAKKKGKNTGSEELSTELAALRRRVGALKTQKKAEEMAITITSGGGCEKEAYELSGVNVSGFATGLDALEISVRKAKTEAELVAAVRDLDLFKLTLPK